MLENKLIANYESESAALMAQVRAHNEARKARQARDARPSNEDASRADPAPMSRDEIALIDPETGRPRPQAAVLIDIGRQARMFHDPGGDPFAEVNGRSVPIGGTEHREWLARRFFQLTSKGANRNSIGDAANTLAALAKYEGPCEPVFLRVAGTDDRIEIDLGDDTGDAVIVTPAGWSLGKPSVNFRRSGKMVALPRPANPDFSLLWRHVNVAEQDRPLVAAWLLAALRPRGPYPIALLIGEQGSGKSTAARVLKRLVDPSAVLLRPPPREDRDLQVAAVQSWCVCLDNLSGLQPQTADTLCRLATGGGLAQRRLYSDTDEVLVEVQRPLILNGIDDVATRPDLADRCLHLLLPPLTQRQTEAEIGRVFERDAPSIFAALLDGLALALREHKNVKISPLPRMADFAVWAAAGLPALGVSADAFLAAYERNRAHLAELAIESSPVAAALVRFMIGRSEWTGPANDLLSLLAQAEPEHTSSNTWPRSAKGLHNVLRRLAPALRSVGIEVVNEHTRTARTVRVCKVGKQASQASQASQAPFHAASGVTRCDTCDGSRDAYAGQCVTPKPASDKGRDTCDACDTSKRGLHVAEDDHDSSALEV